MSVMAVAKRQAYHGSRGYESMVVLSATNPHLHYDAWELPALTGRAQRPGRLADAARQDPPGFLCFGPNQFLPPGRYGVEFRFSANRKDAGEVTVGKWDVTLGGTIVTGGLIQAGMTAAGAVVNVATQSEVEARIYFGGKGVLCAESVDIRRMDW